MYKMINVIIIFIFSFIITLQCIEKLTASQLNESNNSNLPLIYLSTDKKTYSVGEKIQLIITVYNNPIPIKINVNKTHDEMLWGYIARDKPEIIDSFYINSKSNGISSIYNISTLESGKYQLSASSLIPTNQSNSTSFTPIAVKSPFFTIPALLLYAYVSIFIGLIIILIISHYSNNQLLKNLFSTDWKINIFWINLVISLLIALYFAYLETFHENNLFDMVLPPHVIEEDNELVIQNNTSASNNNPNISPSDLEPPFIPRFIILWGYIGSAVYVLKVTTGKLKNKDFQLTHLPDHLARLFIGTILAVFTFFILVTGGFFGLTIDVTKMTTNPEFITYVYATIAFVAGYSVRHIILIISTLLNAVLRVDSLDERKGNATKKEKENEKDS